MSWDQALCCMAGAEGAQKVSEAAATYVLPVHQDSLNVGVGVVAGCDDRGSDEPH